MPSSFYQFPTSDFSLQNNDKLTLVVGRKKNTSSNLKRPSQQAQNGTALVASSEDVVDGGLTGAANGAPPGGGVGGDGVNSGKDFFRYGWNIQF